MPQLRLSSGRILSFRTFGPVDGRAVFHCHGIAGSGLDAALYGDAPDRAGIRLISPDRPGLGESEFQAGRKILDWPDDVVELADYLDITSFSVIGVSGGAPYALACAHRIPQRTESCGILSGAGPAGLIPAWEMRFRATYLGIRRLPGLYNRFAKALTAWRAAHPTEHFAVPPMLLAHADAMVLRNPEISSILARTTAEGSRQGHAGPALEGILLANEWGFDPSEIRMNKFFLWHGEADRIVPVGVGRSMASVVPNGIAKFYPDEGHYSLMVHYAAEILAELIRRPSGPTS